MGTTSTSLYTQFQFCLLFIYPLTDPRGNKHMCSVTGGEKCMYETRNKNEAN